MEVKSVSVIPVNLASGREHKGSRGLMNGVRNMGGNVPVHTRNPIMDDPRESRVEADGSRNAGDVESSKVEVGNRMGITASSTTTVRSTRNGSAIIHGATLKPKGNASWRGYNRRIEGCPSREASGSSIRLKVNVTATAKMG